ncbi:heavy metal translocating P-type ATPase [Roseicyclus persicicus]|uniref:Cadmium-translocating P-type ATPase n=1 Tax=Roseicyclus persicicus TaxID=2650661 RepID=A0A7X6JVR4_9RHOB|nr:heavy metal translocating P-type ATPase [Roseibacterium persicicum]NKX42960.1 cadmium-translocating P-type ATPase [Roseibacterium persicicum]
MPRDTSDTTTRRYAVDNLSCGSCVARAETALAAVPGVRTAEVNLATRRATLETGAGFDPAALDQAMVAAGYPVRPLDAPPLRVSVGNLNCGGCASRAETALNALPEVLEAQVNLALKRADLRLAPGADWARVEAAMETAGYPVTPLDPPAGAAPASAPEHEPEDEAAPMRRAFLIAAALSLPVVVLEMGGHIFPAFHHWQMATFGAFLPHLVQFLLTTAVLAGPGRVFFRLGVPALLKRAPEMNSLVVLGTSAAWAWSTVVTFAPGLVPETGRFVYFEAAAVIVTLILLGRWLEARARGRAGAAIRSLMALRPDTAIRVAGGSEREVPLADLRRGDLIRLKPGGRVAVDGTVVEGDSYVDEAMLTGEPLPVAKRAGDSVTAGTVNGTGTLVYRATAVGADTVLARIVAMVEDAQATRLPVQSLINKVTAIFVPVVLAIAIVAAGAWLIWGGDPAKALVIGVSVLIIACPCAMGLATPVSILAGTGRAAELGVLFRKGDALQELSRVNLVAFDKTGTLTEGRPVVTAVTPSAHADDATLLALAAGAEAASEHPLARAILAEAGARGLAPAAVHGFEAVTGGGVRAQVAGETLRVGSRAFLSSEGVAVPPADPSEATEVHVARGALYLGHLSLSDPLKPEAARAVAALKARGLRVAMMSGDAEGPVQAAAATLGIAEAHARLSPADKRAQVAAWRAEGLRVAFVGDGLNDAAVLAEADVGIALGTGTDVAIEAGDVVLVSGAPTGVVTAMEVSRRTLRNIAQNLVWAFGYNVALIPVAAGLLALAGGPLLNPMLAAGAMAASSVLVVLNALRLRRMVAA